MPMSEVNRVPRIPGSGSDASWTASMTAERDVHNEVSGVVSGMSCRPAMSPSRAPRRPEDWAAVTPDENKQALALLTGADVRVPESFTGAALDAVRQAAADDLRLAEAVAQVEDGRITQFLAGVPALLDRYRNAPAAPCALIDAAVHARRLGHGPALPRVLLEAAAPGYLSDDEWETLDDDWLAKAFAYAGARCRGVRGPLTPIRPPGEQAPAEPHYRLADYLEQVGRRRGT